jgi:hypothetical protein
MNFINWRLGFRQSSFRHITRVPQRPTFDAFAMPAAFLACCCPLHLSDPGKPSDPGILLQSLPAEPGICQSASWRTVRSCGLPGCRKFWRWLAAGSRSGQGERSVPSPAVGDDVQQALGVRHVIGVAGDDGFPGVAGRVGCWKTERFEQPGAPVGSVVGESLAGPLAGHQDPAPGVAEVFAAMRLALAVPRAQAGPGVLGLDAVAQPVRAGRRARLVPRASARRSACSCWAGVWASWQSATCLVRYLVR